MLPLTAYLYPSGAKQIENESNDRYEIDLEEGVKKGYLVKYVSDDGKQVQYVMQSTDFGCGLPVKGATFPIKAFADAGAVFGANVVKALFIETLKLFSWRLLLINKQKAFNSFNRIGFKILSPFILKDAYLTKFSREFHLLLSTFLTEIGINESTENLPTFGKSFSVSLLFVHLIEYDNVYRLRLEDIFSETSKERLQNPRKELKRLLLIMKSREVRPGEKGKAIHAKFSYLVSLLCLVLIIPKYKRAFLKAVNSVNFDNLRLDTIDTYWVNLRNDYLFRGMSEEERKQDSITKNWVYPEPIK